MDLAKLRTDYARAGLSEGDLAETPALQLERWLRDAVAAGHPEPNAMTFVTVSPDGEPSPRVVLCRGLDERGIVFFTNYASAKGRDLETNPRAAANFFWVLLERQARVNGTVTKVTRAESEAYFATRPRESQLGAWASEQSSVLTSRADLEERLSRMSERFGDGPIPCPPHWGGYRLSLDRLELWQGRPSRLHDRLRYTRIPTGWRLERLSP
jgi:pyridoxamine 5'-phosphate oxidase